MRFAVLIGVLESVLFWDKSEARALVSFANAPFAGIAPAAAVAPAVIAPSIPGYISNSGIGGTGGNRQICFAGQCFSLSPSSSSSPAGLVCNSGACIPSTTRFNNPSGSNYTYSGASTNNLWCVTNSLCYVYNSNNNYGSSSGSSSGNGVISNVNFGSSSYTFTTSSCSSGTAIGTVTASGATSYDIGGGPFAISSSGQITSSGALTNGQTYSTVVTGYDNTFYGTNTASVSITANCGTTSSSGTCIFNGVLCYTTG